jgi:hypothetical protein
MVAGSGIIITVIGEIKQINWRAALALPRSHFGCEVKEHFAGK